MRPRTPLTQAGAVNGSRARALTARPPNLRRSPAHLRNVSRWKRKTTLRHRTRVGSSARSNRKQEKSMISSHFPEIHRLSAKKGLAQVLFAGRRAGVPLWPVVCPMPAGGSAVKGRQRGGRLPVAERAEPLDGTANRWHLHPEQSGGHKKRPAEDLPVF